MIVVRARKKKGHQLTEQHMNELQKQGFVVNAYGELVECTLPNDVNAIRIPEGILKIQDGVFRNRVVLTTVEFPKSLVEIGSQAFYNCSALAEIQMPPMLEVLEREAFAGTAWVRNKTNQDGLAIYGHTLYRYHGQNSCVCIPEGVRLINQYAFHNCDCVTKVVFPLTLGCIGKEAFSGCTSLETVENMFVNTQVEHIEADAFLNTPWLNGKVDAKGFVICDGALLGYQGTEQYVTIPDAVEYIADAVFLNCESIQEVTISERVSYIGCQAFCGCRNLAKVNMSHTVYIDCDAFFGTPFLDAITDENGFSIYQNQLLGYEKEADCVAIPESVKVIARRVFYNCDFIKEITIPQSVQLIWDEAFMGCTALAHVVIPDTVESIEYGAFRHCRLESLTLPIAFRHDLSFIFAERLADTAFVRDCLKYSERID